MGSIRAVAAHAGVSPATVSRVINERGYVSAEVRARVLRAIAELDFRPNIHARRLRGVESRLIALLFTQVAHPYSAEIALAIDEIAQQRGYMVLVGNSHREDERFRRYLNTFIASGVDGLVIVPPSGSEDVTSALAATPLPYVLIDQSIPSLPVDQVVSDNVAGAYQVTCQLVRDGHRRIAFIGGHPKSQKGRDRLAGYTRALQEHDVPVDPELILMRDADERSGYDLTTVALGSRRPDALFAANMDVQVGMLRAVRESGWRAPGDITLSGFDDLPYAAEYSPVSVVAAQQTRTIGVIATQLLIDKLEGKRQRTEHQVVLLQPRLIVRTPPGSALTPNPLTPGQFQGSQRKDQPWGVSRKGKAGR